MNGGWGRGGVGAGGGGFRRCVLDVEDLDSGSFTVRIQRLPMTCAQESDGTPVVRNNAHLLLRDGAHSHVACMCVFLFHTHTFPHLHPDLLEFLVLLENLACTN